MPPIHAHRPAQAISPLGRSRVTGRKARPQQATRPGWIGLETLESRTLLAGTPFPIANAPGNELAIDAAFDGANFLVGVAQGGTAFRGEVGAQLVSPAGARIGSLISTGRTGSPPMVAFGGDNYLLAWSDLASSPDNDIYGAILSPAGDLGNPFVINDDSGRQDIGDIAFDGTNYLVTWRSNSGNDVMAQLVSPTGQPLGPQIPIALDQGNCTPEKPLDFTALAVAFDGTQYLAVWEARRPTGPERYDIMGAFISPVGVVSAPFQISQASSPAWNWLSLDFDGRNYLVVWGLGTGPAILDNTPFDVYGRFVSPTGKMATGELPIATGRADQTTMPGIVAFTGTNYLVSWFEGSSPTNTDVYARYISPAGKMVGLAKAIGKAPGFQCGGALAIGAGKCLVIINDGNPFDAAPNLNVLGTFEPLPVPTVSSPAMFSIANTLGNELAMDAAFDGANFLVGFAQGGTTFRGNVGAQLLSPAGTRVGELVATGGTGSVPMVAFDGTNYLLAWSDDAPSPDYDIRGAIVSPAGNVVRSSFVINQDPGRQDIGNIAFDGTNYLVTWTSDSGNDVMGQLVSPDGSLLGSEIIIAQDQGHFTPSVDSGMADLALAFDGTQYLAVWVTAQPTGPEQHDVRGAFISKAGTVSVPFQVNQRSSPSFNPVSLAFDGHNYLVVWNLDTGPGYPSLTQFDVYGRFVSPAGTMGTSEFPIATGRAEQVNLPNGLAFDGTNYLVSWAQGLTVGPPTRADVYARYVSPAGTLVGPVLPVATGPGTQIGAALAFGAGKFLAVINDNVTDLAGSTGNSNVLGTFLPFAPPVVSIVATDPAASENGDAGQFTISRSTISNKPLKVTVAFSGTARNGTDYTRLTTTVTIPADAASVTVNVVPIDDGRTEPAETVTLTLRPGLAYQVDPAQAADTVTIADATYLASDFFPLTDGARWDYLELSNSEPCIQYIQAIAQGDGTEWRSTVNGDSWWSLFQSDANGISLISENYGNGTTTYNPAHLWLPGTMAIGGTYPISGSYSGAVEGSVSGTITVLKVETVRVPAGTFRCLKVQTVIDEQETAHSNHETWTFWLARYIGIVAADGKSTEVDHGVTSRGTDSLRLTSWSLVESQWQARAPMNDARDQFAAVVIDNQIYVFGGEGQGPWPDNENLSSTERYDPPTDVWAPLADNPHTPDGVQEAAGAAVNGKFYVIGEKDGNLVEEYDPQTNQWTTKAPKPTGVSHAVCAVYNDEIFVFGGILRFAPPRERDVYTNVIEAYKPATDTWRVVTRMPVTVVRPAVAIVGDKAYVLGGLTSYLKPAAVTMAFDFSTGKWTKQGLAAVSLSRAMSSGAAAPVYDGKIYLVGGWQITAGLQWTTNRVDIYDTVTNTWSVGPSLPAPIGNHDALIADDAIYVVGGLRWFNQDPDPVVDEVVFLPLT